MKLLQLSKFYPPVLGGIEVATFELTEGLNKLGLSTDVLCANTQNSTVRETAAAGYSITRAASLGLLLSTSMAPALLRELWRNRDVYDVIHLHLPDPMTSLALYLTRPRGRLVVHWHSDIVNQKRALRLYAPLQQWLLRRSAAIVVTSRRYADSSPWLQPFADKIHVVPNAICDPRPAPCAARDNEVAALRRRYSGKRLVFSLGRLASYKGFDVLIRAARQLDNDVQLIIAGSGQLLDKLREQVRVEGVDDKVDLVGAVSNQEASLLFEAAEIYCLPSTTRAEAFGMVLIEAMAHGRAIVATDIPGSGVPWVNQHGETGLNVAPDDPTALAVALSQLLADSVGRRRMGEAGRRRFEREFLAGAMVERMVVIYEKLLGRTDMAQTCAAAARRHADQARS